MKVINLPVIQSVIDDICEFHATQTTAVPAGLCMDLLTEIPKPLLVRILPPALQIRGFRAPAKAPIQLLIDTIMHRDPRLLCYVLNQSCLDVIQAICEQPLKQLRTSLVDLVEEHSATRVQYALLVDRRKSVRKLHEQVAMLTAAQADKTDQTPDEVAVATDAPPPDVKAVEASEIEGVGRVPQPVLAQPKQKKPKHNVNAALQKRLAQAEKLVAVRDGELRQLRQEQGKRDRVLGQLRHDLDSKEQELEQLRSQLRSSKLLIGQLQHLQQESQRVAEHAHQLEIREKAFAAMFGSGAAEFKTQLVDSVVHIHDLESRLTGLHLLLNAQAKQQDLALASLAHTTPIPVSQCVTAVKSYLETLVQQQVAQVAVGTTAISERIAHVDGVKELLQTLAVLDKLEPKAAQATTYLQMELPQAALRQSLAATEQVQLELVGTLRYEGPHAWLVTQDHVIGLPPGLIDQDDLVTGNQVRLLLYHDRNSLVELEAEVISRVESQVINDALRVDDDGLYVQAYDGQRVMVSQFEFLRAQVEVDAPLQVIAPKWPSSLNGSQALYGRIAKKLECTGPCLQRRQVMFSAPKKSHSASEALELLPILKGQSVLVVGGNGNEQCYKAVVEGMGGRFDWQSGFDQLARIPGKVRAADLVIVVTGCVLHAASGLAETEAKRTHKLCSYFNTFGRTSFIRYLQELYPAGLVESSAVV